MKKKLTILFAVLTTLGFIALTILFISRHNIAMLEPKGWIAMKQRNLLVIASLLMLIVVIPVFLLTLIFAIRYRSNHQKSRYTPDWEHSTLGETIWWGIPFLIITVLATFTWISSYQLSPFKPLESSKEPLTIQVIALEWKWLFIYPKQGIATVNYIQFPVDTPINFEITADAPMNSFWIPQLGGQIYAMPAMRSQLHLIAQEEGVYRGSAANLSGKGFAGMVFDAKATTEKEFENWVQKAKSKGASLNHSVYYKLSQPSQYNPVTLYHLSENKLFDQVMDKYLKPTKTPISQN